MSRRLALLLLVASVLGAIPARAAPDDLPSDPALVRGELENGLRYVVRRHAHPPGRASIWLHVHSGSVNETDRQHGIAHYLEHMAFNGSENFPPGSVVPFFQSLGMTFGRDQNAFTSFDQTTYQLTLPDAKAETVGKGMTYFADVLHRLLILPKEIESERQIIQEERRRGLSGRQRVRDHVLERIAPGSRVAQRLPIGTEQSIDAFVEKDFRDYYSAWYTASNATILVVADADSADIVKAIGAAFSSAPKRPRPTPLESGVRAPEASFAVVATDAEIDAEEVRITRLSPAGPPVTTRATWRDDVVVGLGVAALNRRLEDKVARGGTAYLSANVESGDEGRLFHSWEVSGRAAPGKWKPALEELALELQRARIHGFTAREIDDAKKQWLARAERDVETEATAPARALMGRMNAALVSGSTMTSPQQRLELLASTLPAVEAAEVSKRLATELDPKAVAFVAVLPAGPNVPSEAALLEVGTKALAVEPPKEAERERAAQFLAALPKPGEVQECAEHAATGVWTGWLSNGVCVHHKFLDTRRNEVSVDIALVGGELLETAENRGATAAAEVAWRHPATKALSSSDVRALLTGRKVSVGSGGGGGRRGRGGRGGGGGSGVGSDGIALSVSGSPEDLETGLQLAHLLLTEPRIEPAAFEEHRTSQRQAIAEAERNPLALGMRTAPSAAYPDDVRLRPVTAPQLDRLALPATQAWLEKTVRESPIEVVIVGDLPRERAVELARRYLGSLPTRPRVAADTYLPLRTLARPAGPRLVERAIETPTAQAFVLSGCYGPDERERAEVRAMNLAAQILSTRMITEVREQAQLVYSIGAGFRAGGAYPGFGVLSAGAPTEPHKAAALVEKLASLYAAFAATGPTEEEMAVARKQTANTFEQQLPEPSFWAGRLGRLTFRGVRLDDLAADPAAYQALTAKQVKDVFGKHYAKERSIVVVIRPEASGSTQPAPAGTGTPAPGK